MEDEEMGGSGESNGRRALCCVVCCVCACSWPSLHAAFHFAQRSALSLPFSRCLPSALDLSVSPFRTSATSQRGTEHEYPRQWFLSPVGTSKSFGSLSRRACL